MERTEEKVLENLGLIHYVLQKQLHIPVTHIDYEDLYGEGLIGLILAIDRFDVSAGYCFTTFAIPYIRGTIQRYKRDFSLPVHCTRGTKDAIFKVSRALNEGCSTSELQEKTGLSQEEVHDAFCILSVQSFEQTVKVKGDVSEGVTLGDCISSEDPYEEFISEDYIDFCVESVADSIKSSRNREVWLCYIQNARQGEFLKQKVIGDRYNMAQAQVSRILKRYNEKFRKLLEQG